MRWIYSLFFRFRATSCTLRWFFRFCSVHLDARKIFNLSIHPCWRKRPSLVLFEFTQIYIFSTSVDACAIVRWHAQETRTINALLKYLTHAKNILKIYRTFLSAINFFSLFRFRATSCTLRFLLIKVRSRFYQFRLWRVPVLWQSNQRPSQCLLNKGIARR